MAKGFSKARGNFQAVIYIDSLRPLDYFAKNPQEK